MTKEEQSQMNAVLLIQTSLDYIKNNNPDLYDIIKYVKYVPKEDVLQYLLAFVLISNAKLAALHNKLFPGQSLDDLVEIFMKAVNEKIN